MTALTMALKVINPVIFTFLDMDILLIRVVALLKETLKALKMVIKSVL